MTSFIISFCVLFLDQITKFFIEKNLYGKSIEVIDNIFALTYVQNRGAAWGILKDNNLILNILIPVFITIIILYLFFVTKNKYEHILGSLIIGGAIGNYIDRIFRGYVVDFLDFKIWPVFNFADIAIVSGCFLMVVFLIIKGGDKNGKN